ncbi:hypothetical protein BH09PAT3_BH09PAT3_5830 [soil metagenome]
MTAEFNTTGYIPPSPITWQIERDNSLLSDAAQNLMDLEQAVPVIVDVDQSLRPKVIDSCGMTCFFCHNEGTPVASDNKDTRTFLNIAGVSGRVSVFSETNGVNFLPGKMEADDNFQFALSSLQASLGLKELHMTGGEPTLHPGLPQLIRAAKDLGFNPKMTSNGENGVRMLPLCAEAGLTKVNFSIFGTTAEELAMVQHTKYQKTNLANAKIKSLHRSIAVAAEHGLDIGANIVMSDASHSDRIDRVLGEFEPKLSLRILPDLDSGIEAHYAIYEYLARLGAKPVEAVIDAGSSNARVKYRLPDDREVHFKQIRPLRLKEACSDCSFNNPDDCKEGYYGVRLYVDQANRYLVGVCLQRMDITLPLEEFLQSPLLEDVKATRQEDYDKLTKQYSTQL